MYVSFKPYLGVDTLLYDYSLQPGDYLPHCFNSYNSSIDSDFVNTIDSVLIGNSYRKRFNIAQNKSSPTGNASIIEGIGSSMGLMEPIFFDNHYATYLDCYSDSSVSIGGAPCQKFYVGVPAIRKTESIISVNPNPSNGVFTLVCHSELSEESQPVIKVYNVFGELILNETLHHTQGYNPINLTGQPNGIYLYRVIANSGELIGEGKLIIQK